ncbi:MAG TPA: hypothetical protein ENF79_03645 [Nitrososphaeria archaeon]|nr:hypothetical protein [Nitrososphaeria archaeon]
MALDLLMLVREIIFFSFAIPMIFFSLECLAGLRKGRVAASRIFLRKDQLVLSVRSLLLASISSIPASISLFLWSVYRLEVYRLLAAAFFILFVAFIFISVSRLRLVLKG